MAIAFDTPSDRSTDNIITILSPYNIDQTLSEHLYNGSIIQNGGASPIKTYESTDTLGSAGGSSSVIRTGDE